MDEMENKETKVETTEDKKETIAEKFKRNKFKIIRGALIALGTVGAAAAAVTLLTKKDDEPEEFSLAWCRENGISEGTGYLTFEGAGSDNENLYKAVKATKNYSIVPTEDSAKELETT